MLMQWYAWLNLTPPMRHPPSLFIISCVSLKTSDMHVSMLNQELCILHLLPLVSPGQEQRDTVGPRVCLLKSEKGNIRFNNIDPAGLHTWGLAEGSVQRVLKRSALFELTCVRMSLNFFSFLASCTPQAPRHHYCYCCWSRSRMECVVFKCMQSEGTSSMLDVLVRSHGWVQSSHDGPDMHADICRQHPCVPIAPTYHCDNTHKSAPVWRCMALVAPAQLM